MPNHCYGSHPNASQTYNYPKDQIIDFEVKWNRYMRGLNNYGDYYHNTAAVDNLICDWGALHENNLYPHSGVSTMGYSTKTNGFDQNHVAGYALDNLAIFGPVISSTSRTDALYGMK